MASKGKSKSKEENKSASKIKLVSLLRLQKEWRPSN